MDIDTCYTITDSQRMDSDTSSTVTDTSQLGSNLSTITDSSSSTLKCNRKRRNASNDPNFRAQEQMRNSNEAMAMVRQDTARGLFLWIPIHLLLYQIHLNGVPIYLP
jgi:hypothetical protein